MLLGNIRKGMVFGFLGEFGWLTKREERVSEVTVDDMRTKTQGMVRFLTIEVKRKAIWGWQEKFRVGMT